MQHVLIIHEVADYPAWKKVFDGAAGIRKDAGERSYQVLKYEHHRLSALSDLKKGLEQNKNTKE